MREIKFRAWDKDSNKIYSQDDFILTFDTVGEDIYLSKNDEIIPLYRYELMQYTGIKDVNGKEIYEGDIVKYFKDELAIIEFKRGCFVIESENYIDYFYEILGEIEVIGNIYENEDLLEK